MNIEIGTNIEYPDELDFGDSNTKIRVSEVEFNEIVDEYVWSELIENDGEITIRAKWSIDGAASLADAAQKSREFAAYLDHLSNKGYIFNEPVSDDYGFAVLPEKQKEIYDRVRSELEEEYEII